MKNSIIQLLGGASSRLMATVALFVASLTVMAQENILKINDFKVIPGRMATVEVVLENPTPVSSLQFDVKLPDGLTFRYFDKVTERITRSSHTLINGKVNGLLRLGFLTNAADMSNSAIKGTSGAFATLSFYVSPTFKGGKIEISEIVASNGTVDIKDNKVDINKTWTTAVDILVGTLSFASETVEVKNGEKAAIGVNLDNNITVTAMQATLTLPEGLELTEGKDGEWFDYSDRLSQNTSIIANPLGNGQYKVVISSLTNDEFEGYAGELFAINVLANGIENPGKLVLSDIVCTNANGVAYSIADVSLDITVAPTFEDPTQDGKWDIDDVNVITNAVLTDAYDAVNDLNNDGKIDIDDVNIAINKIIE